MAITVGQLRLLVSDPSGADQIYDDAHYESIIEMEPLLYRAAALAARTFAARYANLVDFSEGDLKISHQQKFKNYSDLAEKYENRAREENAGSVATATPVLTGVSLNEIEIVHEDTDRYPPAFKRGMMDNPPGSFDDDSEEYDG